MRRTLIHALMAATMVASLSSLTPAPAAPACAKCLIEGVVSMADYNPDAWSFDLQGLFVGARAMVTDRDAIGVTGSVRLTADVAADTVAGRPSRTYSGVGTLVIRTNTPCLGSCTALLQRDATMTVILRGAPGAWAIQPVATSTGNRGSGGFTRLPQPLYHPTVGTVEYVGTMSAVTQ